jgi:hypothetical protein
VRLRAKRDIESSVAHCAGERVVRLADVALERERLAERPPRAPLLALEVVAEPLERLARVALGLVAETARRGVLRLLDPQQRDVDGVGARSEEGLGTHEVGHRVLGALLHPHDPRAQQVGPAEMTESSVASSRAIAWRTNFSARAGCPPASERRAIDQ